MHIDPRNPPGPESILSWLGQAVETMQLGVTISDVDGRILYTNRAEAEMHGYTLDELVGQHVRIFAPPIRGVRRLSDRELEGAGRWERETTNVRKDGTEFPVRLISEAIHDADGRPVGLLTISEDITERHATEERLRQAQKMEVMGQLTGGIAHDFNNVLTVILANMDFLANASPTDWMDIRDAVRETLSVVRQGASMARQLLAFSRRDRLKFMATDLAKLTEEYHGVLRRLLPEHVELAFALDRSTPAVMVDQHAVQQILLNLVTNASDAMPRGGLLHIKVGPAIIDEGFCAAHGWGRPGEYGAVSVSDSGVGMDHETRRRVFEPFFSTKGEGKGTGLGMAMVYALMKQHRGFVNVYSEPQEGTTVRLWFPAVTTLQGPAATVEKPVIVGGNETILIVEDEAPIRRATERTLQRYGYRVLTAADGEDGYARIKAGDPPIDLVLSDVIMPRLGGQDLLRRVREDGNFVPFVFASGYGRAELQRAIDLEPQLPVIQKPWTVSELLSELRRVLDQRRGR